MRRFFQMMRRMFQKGQRGFTLVELLVVVGIIVALAAVIIPSVAQFAGKGEEGAKAAEQENIQAAVDAMMADTGITAVVVGPATPGTNDWSAVPTGTGTNVLYGATVDDPRYLREQNTIYCYSWDISGLITQVGFWDASITTPACVAFP